MEQFGNAECEDFYLHCLQHGPRDPSVLALARDERFLHFVIQFDLRQVFAAIGAAAFPPACMQTALRHGRTEMFRALFLHSAAHRALLHPTAASAGCSADGGAASDAAGLEAAGQLLLDACRLGAAGAAQFLLRYAEVPRTAWRDGKNCVHHLLEHRLELLLEHFFDFPQLWTTDLLVHLVFQGRTYLLRELLRRGAVPDLAPLLPLAYSPAVRALLEHELNLRNRRSGDAQAPSTCGPAGSSTSR